MEVVEPGGLVRTFLGWFVVMGTIALYLHIAYKDLVSESSKL